MSRIGILGGSFNPPHLGHLALANQANAELELERTYLIPARVSPLKPSAADPGADHRLRMCRLLVQGQPGVSTCALEVERDGPSYTVETLREIHASHPQADLTLLMGADTARTLPRWREPAELLQLARVAVAARGRSSCREVLDAVKAAGGETTSPAGARTNAAGGRPPAPEVAFLHMAPLDISSSLIRRCARSGQPLDELAGAAVASYIAREGLYRANVRQER